MVLIEIVNSHIVNRHSIFVFVRSCKLANLSMRNVVPFHQDDFIGIRQQVVKRVIDNTNPHMIIHAISDNCKSIWNVLCVIDEYFTERDSSVSSDVQNVLFHPLIIVSILTNIFDRVLAVAHYKNEVFIANAGIGTIKLESKDTRLSTSPRSLDKVDHRNDFNRNYQILTKRANITTK